MPERDRRSGGSNRAASGIKVARPRIRSLETKGTGPFRLNWLGGIHRTSRYTAGGYEISVQFVDKSRPQSAIEVSLPLGAINLLALGTEWRQSYFKGYSAARTATVTIDLSQIDPKGPHQAVDPLDVIPKFDYTLHAMADRGWCRVLPTMDGSELVFPNAELVRTWYLFDPDIVQAVLADAIANPGPVSKKLLPWNPERTYRINEDAVHMCYRPGFSESSMKRLARILFDPIAVSHVHRFAARFRSFGGRDHFQLPWVLPPTRGKITMQIRYVDLQGWVKKKRPPRRLVLSVLGVKYPSPFNHMMLEPWIDTRQGDENGRANLPVVPRRTSRLILPDDGGLSLYGQAGDSKLDSAPLEALAFQDNIFDVTTTKIPRGPQTHRSGGGGPPPAEVGEAGMDPGGIQLPGVAPASGSDAIMRGSRQSHVQPATTFIEIQPVFDDVVGELQQGMRDWSIRYLETNTSNEGILNVQSSKTEVARPFLVVHLKKPGRNVYVLRAGCHKDYESYSILICERPTGVAVSRMEFAEWLGGFPYPYGSGWLDVDEGGLELRVLKYVKHQQRRKGFDPEIWRQQFAERLTRKVIDAVS